jgi:hypothetical protein
VGLEDRVTQELIGELYRRYMCGELVLDDAAEQIFALMQGGGEEPAGLSVATGALDPADQERTFALFGRLQWHALRQALPDADIPMLGAQEFLAGLDDLEKENDIE